MAACSSITLVFLCLFLYEAKATFFLGCTTPNIPNARVESPDLYISSYRPNQKYQPTTRITIRCIDGHQLNMRSHSLYFVPGTKPTKLDIECGAAAAWVPSIFGVTCEPIKGTTCSPSASPGLVVSPRKSSYSVKTGVKYSCTKGYVLYGSTAAVCLSSGKFSSTATCKEIVVKTCSTPVGPALIVTPAKSTYSVNDAAAFSCKQGYRLDGHRAGICLSTGRFSSIPKCRAITKCSYPGTPVNGKTVPAKPTYTTGFIVQFKCESGYVLVGREWARCSDNGKFSEMVPSCSRKTNQCPEPSVPENGFIMTISHFKSYYDPGEYVKFGCEDGFILVGEAKSVCSSDGVFKPSRPECRPKKVVVCKFPGAPANGKTAPSKNYYNPGEAIKFTCDSGYKLHGKEQSLCTNSGYFSNSVPVCKPITQCEAPILSPTGYLIIVSEIKDNYSVGESIVLACKSGYVIVGVVKLTCGIAGVFDNELPSCKAVKTCQVPKNPANGVILSEKEPGGSYFEGEVIGYKCNDGYVLSGSEQSTCTDDNGELLFTPAPPVCKTRGCSPPAPLLNGNITNLNADDDSAYELGHKIGYICDEGYRLRGAEERTCSASVVNGQLAFRPEAAVCERITCIPPPESDGRSYLPDKNHFSFGDEVLFECDVGYVLRGESTVTCIGQDVYSDDFPTCERLQCSKPVRPENGRVDPYRRAYTVGEAVTFTCRNGYKLVGSSKATCTETSESVAAFLPKSPTCQRKTCDKPHVPQAGILFPERESYYIGEIVSFSCEVGYTLKGESEVICIEEGTFSGKSPECEVITCDRPDSPDNGYIKESGRIFKYLEKVTYVCDVGYELEGYETRTCKESGEFSSRAPSCKEITCKIPSFIRNGGVSPRGVLYITYRDEVRYTCRSGFTMVGESSAICQEDGNLSEEVPSCSPVTCDPPRSTGRFLSYSPVRSKYAVDDTLTYECAEGYRLTGVSESTCLDSGKFSRVTARCEIIVCGYPGTIINGEINPEKDEYKYEDQIFYQCLDGYKLVGDISSTCESSGRFSGELPACDPHTCAGLGPLRFGSVDPLQANYKFEDSVKFSCRPGYTLVGASSARCLRSGEFSASLPKCERSTCDRFGNLEFGTVFPRKVQYFVNERVTFSCDYGYELEGSTTSTCLSTGRFSHPLPTCQAVACNNPGAPKFGSISPDLPQYKLGDDITYICDDGYVLRGSSVAICVDENMFSTSAPVCEEISCSFPGNPRNGVTFPSQSLYSVNTVVRFECRPGYVIDEAETARCLKGGQFSEDTPSCERITCSNPGAPEFGRIYPDRPNYRLGQKVSFSCKDGYELKGEHVISCDEDGSFSDDVPTCKSVKCDYPGQPVNGVTKPRVSSYDVGDLVTYVCDDGYLLVGIETARCTASGSFTGYLPSCQRVTCRNPGLPLFGTISPDLQNYAVGDQVTFQCKDGYTIVGQTDSVCQDNGDFSGHVPTCKEVSCSFPGNPSKGLTTPARLSYAVGELVRFECRDGYVLSGETSAVCQESGKFSALLPSCLSVNCKNPGRPRYGAIFPDASRYGVGDEVAFSCDDGYTIKGSESAVCQESGGFSATVPVCERVSCKFPGNPVDGFTTPTRLYYSIGEEVTFDCAEGYSVVGAETAVCTKSTFFSEELPECTRTTCSFPGRPISGYTIPNLPTYDIGEKVGFSCRRGFTLDGSSQATCGEDGMFDSTIPKCKRSACKFPGNPENGETTPTQATFSFRERVTFSCRDGYVIVGAVSARCLLSGSFSEPLPACTSVACKNPGSPRFGDILPNQRSYSVDQVVKFSCDDGYDLVGYSSSTCLETGQFSEPLPTCDPVRCSFPGNPNNGFTSPTETSFLVGEAVSFSCVDGYELVGASSAECEEDGEFSPRVPRCERVTCMNPGSPANGIAVPDLPRYAVRQKVVFRCNDGYSMVGVDAIVCENNGQFTHPVPKCVAITCSNPGSLVNGDIVPDFPTYSAYQKVTFTCDEGYELVGVDTSVCQSNGDFSHAVPACQRVTCSNPGRPVHGLISPDLKSYSTRQQVVFSCKDGYELDGYDTSVCHSNGLFSHPVPKCERITCANPGYPENGLIIPDLSAYFLGQKVTFRCDKAYELKGAQTSVCEEDGGFSQSVPTCIRITCDNPGYPVNGVIIPDLTLYSLNQIVAFRCNDGYELVGVDKSVCQTDGSFSYPVPKCEKKVCSNPGVPDFGTISPDLPNYEIGQKVTFSCKEGYRIEGNTQISCDERGIFFGRIPQCKPITCKFPGNPLHGDTTPSRFSYSYEEDVTFRCDDGYFLVGETTARCGSNGIFSGSLPTCERNTCDNPGKPNYGLMSPNIPKYAVGQQIQYTCEDGYKLEGESKLTCGESGSFLGKVPSCREITCVSIGNPINGVTRPLSKTYSYGDVITFRCDEGYVLMGFASARCTASGMFSARLPLCELETCDYPGNPKNGMTTPTRLKYGVDDEVTFSCREGFSLNGQPSSKCLNTGQFSGTLPTCHKVSCRNPGKPKFGYMTPNVLAFAVGQSVTFACDLGYRMQGSAVSTCLYTGDFSEPVPTCERVPACRNPGAPVRGSISSSRPFFDVKDSVTFTCDFGYRLEGTSVSECLTSGKFSSPVPTCEAITCSFPGKPRSGSTEPQKLRYSVGEMVSYRCNDGYVRIGIASSKCTGSGEFLGNIPTCNRVVCAIPGAINFGRMEPDKPTYYTGQIVRFSCLDEYRLKGSEESTCGIDGEFTSPFPTCERIVCRNPGAPVRGSVSPDLDRYLVGETATYLCQKGYKLDGPAEAICQKNGKFDHQPSFCRRMTCQHPGALDFGFVSPTLPVYSLGQIIHFRCIPGYDLTGANSAVCEENGEFSNPLPSCTFKLITCGYPGAPVNGETLPKKTDYSLGEPVTFQCFKGYVIFGAVGARCSKGGIFSEELPICKRVTCNNPGSPVYGSIKPDLPSYSVSQTVTFDCINGYEVVGANTSRCDYNGRFTDPVPRCERTTCSHPGKPDYGTMTPNRPTYSIGQKITFQCSEGYQLVGQTMIKCEADGTFSDPIPTCTKQKTCANPGVPEGGSIDPSYQSYSVDQRVNFMCNVGYRMIGAEFAICQDNGRFSDPLPICEMVTCKNPGIVKFGSMFPELPVYASSQSIKYFCDDGYVLVGASTITCKEGKFDEPPPECQRITCTFPGSPTNGKTVPRKQSYNLEETVEYRCDPGHSLVGADSGVCKRTGSFSADPPLCRRISCSFPGSPVNGQAAPMKLSYDVEESVVYSCQKGYNLVGDESAVCMNTGKFSSSPPLCNRAFCRYPGAPTNGNTVPRKITYDIDETISYECDDGYDLEGAKAARCLSNGEFTAQPPMCTKVVCRFPGSLKNGETIPRRQSYTVGESVEYRCEPDYSVVGEANAVCTSSGEFSFPPAQCRRTSCSYPGEPKNGNTTPRKSSYNVGDEVNYKCNQGFDLEGAMTASCLTSGEFSAPPPTCKKTVCRFPGSPVNGKTVPRKATYTVIESVEYRCNPGYELVGSSSANCEESGEFSSVPPVCKRASCAFPGSPNNGLTKPRKRVYDVDEVVTYECDDGYKLIGDKTARCMSTGEFTAPPPTCTSVQCQYPGEPENGSTLPRRTSYEAGDIIEFACDTECYELKGSATAICMSDGQFSQKIPTCELKICLDFPPIPEYGTLIPLQHNYTCNQKIDYKCFDGYRQSGASHTTCQSNGKFGKGTAKCTVVQCKKPPQLHNGYITADQGVYVFGTVVTYKCKRGYQLFGEDSIKCGEDGQYVGSVPDCREIFCKRPAAPLHGTINTKGQTSWSVGEMVDFKCGEHYTMIGDSYTVCQSSGEWAHGPPTCEAPNCKDYCYLPQIRGRPCQCDTLCQQRDDCCGDYQSECTRGTCQHRCGSAATPQDRCSCDGLCATRFGKRCCKDYRIHCPVTDRHQAPHQ